jgi:Protein of unknown function (DUF3096)
MFNRRLRLLWPLLLIIALPLMAQTRGGVTIHYAMAGPFLALIAGVLILMVPRILNYVVAIYLILVGLIGIFGR